MDAAASAARPGTASYSRTGWPATSATWAIPWPMVPVPTTATVPVTVLLRSFAVMPLILPDELSTGSPGPLAPTDRSVNLAVLSPFRVPAASRGAAPPPVSTTAR